MNSSASEALGKLAEAFADFPLVVQNVAQSMAKVISSLYRLVRKTLIDFIESIASSGDKKNYAEYKQTQQEIIGREISYEEAKVAVEVCSLSAASVKIFSSTEYDSYAILDRLTKVWLVLHNKNLPFEEIRDLVYAVTTYVDLVTLEYEAWKMEARTDQSVIEVIDEE